MGRFFKKNRKLLGVAILIFTSAFFLFWEFVGRNNFLFDDVVVLKQSVLEGTVIEEDMLELKKYDIGNILETSIRDKKIIVGMQAKNYIPANTQLVLEYFDNAEFVLENDEKIMKIPDQWLHSFPQTLRRGDKVSLYAVDMQLDEEVKDFFIDDRFMFNSTVAYVKDNANREVESLDPYRFTGSANVSDVEIIVKDAEFEILKDYASKGFMFALLYR